jgi:competence protein ComEC
MRWLSGVIFYFVFFMTGLNSCLLYTSTNYPDHFLKSSADYFIVRIITPATYTGKVAKTDAEVIACFVDSGWVKSSGKIKLYFQSESTGISYGHFFIIHGKPAKIPKPLNPDEFNYANYLAGKNVYAQLYVASDKFKQLSMHDVNFIFDFSWKLRDYLVSILKRSLPEEDIYGVASALLVGYEEDIGSAVLKAYSSSGTLHVLSVSGMHVALIYKVLEWLFSFLLKMNRGRHVYFASIIICVWFYSLLSGLSPSVLRAAMMLTIVVVGKWLSRTSSVYNCMFVSCFILLAFNPFLLQEVGFQLSLLAVGGIVFVHPLLFRIYTPPGKLMYAVWSVISISLCAQLMTFPIGIFYFHQFPNLFLISNLIIIPATTVAIYASILLVMVSKVPLLGYITGKIVYISIWLSNETALMTDQIPGAVIFGISIKGYEVVFLYILIILLIIFLLRRQALYLALLFAGGIIFSSFQCFENIKVKQQYAINVFAVKGKSVILFREGSKAFMMLDKQDSLSDPGINYHCSAYLYSKGINPDNNEELNDTSILARLSQNVFLFHNKRVVIADSLFFSTLNYNTVKLRTDILIIKGYSGCNSVKTLKYFDAGLIVLDAAFKPWKAAKLKKEFLLAGVPSHDVQHDGAFTFERKFTD